jgi:hypothetical protein
VAKKPGASQFRITVYVLYSVTWVEGMANK